jgi:hypothetical protein
MRTVAVTLACLVLAGLCGIPYPASGSDFADSPASGSAVLMSIKVMPDAAAIAEGSRLQYTAVGVFSHGRKKNITSIVQWNSSAANVVVVGATGLATTVAGGVPPGGSPAQVTITASLRGISGTAALTVTNNLTSISVGPANALVYVGSTLPFTATGTFQDGSTQDITEQATWSSSNPAVLTIISSGSGAGTATGVVPGTSAVTASDAGINGVNTATVAPPPITASFFGMTIGDDVTQFLPSTVPIGSIGHPSQLAWAEIEYGPGKYSWDYYNKYVEWAAENNIPFTMTFGTTPDWASSQCKAGQVCTYPPDNMQYWTDFIQAVLTHYNGITCPKIPYYELWDEADDGAFWYQGNYNGMTSYQNLAALAAAAKPLINGAGSLLLMPSVTDSLDQATAWLTSYFAAQGDQFADGASFHGYVASNTDCSPYPFPEDNFSCSGYGDIVTRTTTFQSIFNSDPYLAGKPIFDSEGSWGKDNVTDINMQVAWLARWYLLQAGTGALQQATWFTWGLSSLMNTDASNQWGQITTDMLANGVDTATPTDAGLAYGYLYNWLVGASVSPCSQSSNVWTCVIARPGGYQALAIWYYSTDETDTTTYTPGTQFPEYLDLYGNVVPINPAGSPVTIGPQPILLETGPLPEIKNHFPNGSEWQNRMTQGKPTSSCPGT